MGTESVGDRRPIASRNWAISQASARWLAQKGASPNAISVAGMICGLLAGVSLAATSLNGALERFFWIIGAGLIQLRLLANMFDGMVAVESGKTSRLGELYNEVPDRISDSATLIGLGYAAGGNPLLGFAAALAAIFTAYIRAVGKVAGAAQEFCGPMAKQQRMFVVTPVALWNGVTPQSCQPAWGDSQLGPATAGLIVIVLGGLVTALRRLLRIAAQLKKEV
jgi:phosphatidylglycerophosphate synthase